MMRKALLEPVSLQYWSTVVSLILLVTGLSQGAEASSSNSSGNDDSQNDGKAVGVVFCVLILIGVVFCLLCAFIPMKRWEGKQMMVSRIQLDVDPMDQYRSKSESLVQNWDRKLEYLKAGRQQIETPPNGCFRGSFRQTLLKNGCETGETLDLEFCRDGTIVGSRRMHDEEEAVTSIHGRWLSEPREISWIETGSKTSVAIAEYSLEPPKFSIAGDYYASKDDFGKFRFNAIVEDKEASEDPTLTSTKSRSTSKFVKLSTMKARDPVELESEQGQSSSDQNLQGVDSNSRSTRLERLSSLTLSFAASLKKKIKRKMQQVLPSPEANNTTKEPRVLPEDVPKSTFLVEHSWDDLDLSARDKLEYPPMHGLK